MDEKKVREAIELIDGIIEVEVILPEGVGDINKALDLAIEALKKQLPKKLVEYHYEEPGEEPYIKYGCGNGCRMQPTRSSKYCNQCGQRIDWSEE